MMLEAATLFVFPALMIFAAFSDLFTMTISNLVSLGLILAFFVLAIAFGLPFDDLAWHVACAFGVLIATFFFFARGWIGGGDAKLATATALWFGFDHLLDYGLYAALMGGALTLGILFLRKHPLPAFLRQRGWIVRLHDKNSGVPYGIALALAGLLLYPQTAIWLAAVGN